MLWVRRIAIILGLLALFALIAALVVGMGHDPIVFGQGRLHSIASKPGILIFLLILSPFALWTVAKNWR